MASCIQTQAGGCLEAWKQLQYKAIILSQSDILTETAGWSWESTEYNHKYNIYKRKVKFLPTLESGWITEIGIHPVDPSCKPPAWFVFHWLGFDYLTSERSPCEGRWHQRVSFEKRYCHLSNLSNNVYVVILQLILQHHFLINKRAIIGTKAMSGSLF